MGLGNVVNSPYLGAVRSPGRKWVLVHSVLAKTSLVMTNLIYFPSFWGMVGVGRLGTLWLRQCLLPLPLILARGLGSAVSSPSGVRGEASAETQFHSTSLTSVLAP